MQKQNYKLANKTEKIEKKGKYQSRKMPKNSTAKNCWELLFLFRDRKNESNFKNSGCWKKKTYWEKNASAGSLKISN